MGERDRLLLALFGDASLVLEPVCHTLIAPGGVGGEECRRRHETIVICRETEAVREEGAKKESRAGEISFRTSICSIV